MRITQGQLRRIIREELLWESYQGFIDRTSNLSYHVKMKVDPTFEEHPAEKEMARTVKRIWGEEADHAFMDSLVKIHWIKAFNDRTAIAKLKNLLSISRRNEIATTGYLPDSDEFLTTWGYYGVIVKGRTTFAANSMDTVGSGYGNRIPDAVRQKYKDSGVPKRPTSFKDLDKIYGPLHKMDDYVLDRESFDTEGPKHWQARQNEFIVDNWKPVAIIRIFSVSHLDFYVDRVRELVEIEKLVSQGRITQDQFEAILIVDDLAEAVQRALAGSSPDEIENSMELYDPPGAPPGSKWTPRNGINLYNKIKEDLTFTGASPGLRKFGLPIVDRKLNTVWAPRGTDQARSHK